MRALARAIAGMELPAVEKISESQARDPFQILIATLLSARTQDATTHAASTRLFKRGPHAADDGAAAGRSRSRQLIYPVSFYRNKARYVKARCETLVDAVRRQGAAHARGAGHAAGRRPQDREPGADPRASRASGNLRRHPRPPHLEPPGLGADRDAGRDRAGALRVIDARWWPYINLYLVTWGQNVCRPVYPRCGDCADRRGLPSASACARSASAIPRRLSRSERPAERSDRGMIRHCRRSRWRSPPASAGVASPTGACACRRRGSKPRPAPAPSSWSKPTRARSSSRPIRTRRPRPWRTSSSWSKQALLQRAALAPGRAGLRGAVRRPADARHDQARRLGPRRQRHAGRRGGDLQDCARTCSGAVAHGARAATPARPTASCTSRLEPTAHAWTASTRCSARSSSGMDVVQKLAGQPTASSE